MLATTNSLEGKIRMPDPTFTSDQLRSALESAQKLNAHIAEHYILSLTDFRYLNNVSIEIKNALEGRNAD